MSSSQCSGGQSVNMASHFEKVDLIWQMGLATLTETDHELRLPAAVSDNLTRDEIIYLENRLSDFLGGIPVVSFKDIGMNTYRVLRMPEMRDVSTSPAASMSPALSTSSISSPYTTSKNFDPKARQYGKKSKIPRPPNAFILYRQKHHPQLKAQNPDLHNNEISVVLGQQWKNEDVMTRNKFKALAEELKRQHLIKFPGYQYTPRKPSEKKRRMTSRKLARMQNANAPLFDDTADFPGCNPVGPVNASGYAAANEQNAAVQASFEDIPTLESILALHHQGGSIMSQSFPAGLVTSNLNNNNNNSVQSITSTAQLQNTVSAPTANNNDFLNSLIDWDAMDEAVQLVRHSLNPTDRPETAQLQGDHQFLPPVTEEELAVIEASIEQTMAHYE